jgi:hypothetical protein
MVAILLNEEYSPSLHHPSLIDRLNVSSHSPRANVLIPLTEGYLSNSHRLCLTTVSSAARGSLTLTVFSALSPISSHLQDIAGWQTNVQAESDFAVSVRGASERNEELEKVEDGLCLRID